MLSSEMKRVTM